MLAGSRVGIVGADSLVGSAVQRLLQRSRYPVRVIARTLSPDLDLRFAGPDDELALAPDFTAPQLIPAFSGLDVLFIATTESALRSSRELPTLLTAAQHADVPHIVMISLQQANPESHFVVSRLSAQLERELIESQIPYTIVRRAPLALDFADYLRADQVMLGPSEQGRVAVL